MLEIHRGIFYIKLNKAKQKGEIKSTRTDDVISLIKWEKDKIIYSNPEKVHEEIKKLIKENI